MIEGKVSSIVLHPERLKPIKRILISQPRPESDKNPYSELAAKFNLQIDFRPFIQIDPVGIKEFRKQKINILEHTAIIFTSKNAIDHLFKLCSESKIEMPPEMKYFCISDQTANYLQKYITIRKRKIFIGKRTVTDLFDLIKKHKTENYLYPCSDIRKDDLPSFMEKSNIKFTEAIIYHTVPSNLKDMDIQQYDLIAFFSPSGVNSLLTNFPEFTQGDILFAAFGPTTGKAITDNNLILDIQAPHPDAPSMTGAIELYIKETEKSNKQ